MATCLIPYADMSNHALLIGKARSELPPLEPPPRCDAGWARLVEECCALDPAARPTFPQLVSALNEVSQRTPPRSASRRG